LKESGEDLENHEKCHFLPTLLALNIENNGLKNM